MIKDSDGLDKISHDIIHAAFDVRNLYGRMMLEKFYEQVMAIELTGMGHKVERQVPVNFEHKGVMVEGAYVADMIVDEKIIIEYKAISCLGGEEFRQLMTYLRLANMRLGFLINFGARDFSFGSFKSETSPFRHGLYRLIN